MVTIHVKDKAMNGSRDYTMNTRRFDTSLKSTHRNKQIKDTPACTKQQTLTQPPQALCLSAAVSVSSSPSPTSIRAHGGAAWLNTPLALASYNLSPYVTQLLHEAHMALSYWDALRDE